MEKRSTSKYVFIGTAVRFLLDSRPGQHVFGPGGLTDNIAKLSELLEEAEYFVSGRLMGGLEKMRKGWLEEAVANAAEAGWEDQRLLTDQECAKLIDYAGTLRSTVLAEADGQVAFIVSDGRYAVSKLLEDVAGLMGDGVYELLPELAQYDFEQAGRAIAFDLPTAAAFHLLRGTEAVLRDFYVRVAKRNRIGEPRMWGPIVSDLRGRATPPPAVLLNNLDSLRAHFRNPTQHPEKVYDIDEAQDLLALAFDAVARMVRYQK